LIDLGNCSLNNWLWGLLVFFSRLFLFLLFFLDDQVSNRVEVLDFRGTSGRQYELLNLS
jgi:hypothetical protein